jgi:polar amino acid transport system substrate-binding protein
MTLSRRSFLSLVAMGIGAPSALVAADNDVDAIDTVRLVYFEDYAPFSSKNPDGSVSGILIECMNVLFKESNIPVHHSALPWERAQSMVENGTADGFCTVVTPKRRDYCLFSEKPILKLEFGIFFLPDHPQRSQIESITTLDDFRRFSLVDYQGNGWAKTMFDSLPVIWTSTQESALKMVLNGRADIIVGQTISIPYLLSKMDAATKLAFVPLKFAEAVPYHLGLRKTFPNVENYLSRINPKVRKLQDRFFQIQATGHV